MFATDKLTSHSECPGPSEVDVRVSDLATSSMVILLIKDVGFQRIQINDSRM